MIRYRSHKTMGSLITLSKSTRSSALRSDWRLPSPWSTASSINTSSTIAVVYDNYQRYLSSPDVTYHCKKY